MAGSVRHLARQGAGAFAPLRAARDEAVLEGPVQNEASPLPFQPDFEDQLDQLLTPDKRAQGWALRHWALALSFGLWVLLPLVAASWYFYARAAPQFASHVGFVVRSDEATSPLSVLGGLADVAGSDAADADILRDFIQSQDMLRRIAAQQDLGQAFVREGDPLFSVGSDRRIEAYLRHWQRRVTVYHDTSSGLIEVRVLAFDPVISQAIAAQIFAESALLVNQLSQQARADATGLAQAEVARAFDRLRAARQALLAFQGRWQIIDPRADIRGHMGLMQSLQNKLAAAQIDLALLQQNARPNETKLAQAQAEITVLERMIQADRDGLGQAGQPDRYADLLAEYEALVIEREFAETTYLAAQAAHDAARAEAQRKARYLARYLGPTQAETAQYPKAGLWLAGVLAVLLGSWGICAVGLYALRDRRGV